MRVFVAGATGAIGRPLMARLREHHDVTAMTRSPERAEALRRGGVDAVVLDAFDRDAVTRAIADAKPEVVVHQLTALPADATPAEATVLALDRGTPGVYNVCDDAPATQNEWLPAIATHLNAPPPFRIPAFVARLAAGTLPVHYATTLRGAANTRAKSAFTWTPRPRPESFATLFAPRR